MTARELPPPASLYIWLARALYLGTHYVPLREYTVSSDQLVVCLEGSIKVKPEAASLLASAEEGEPEQEFRSALLRAGTRVEMSMVDTQDAVVAICYLNPVSHDYQLLEQQMTISFQGAYYGYQNEEQLIQMLRYIRDNQLDAKEAYDIFEQLITPVSQSTKNLAPLDQRIIKVMKLIHTSVRDNLSVAELAESVHISESRLVKLFKTQIGIPITKYRLRYRVFVGVIYMALGFSITNAALAAGFSSTAHFSKCFSAMTGMPPSNQYLRPPYLNVIIDPSIFAAVQSAAAEANYWREPKV